MIVGRGYSKEDRARWRGIILSGARLMGEASLAIVGTLTRCKEPESWWVV